MSFEKAPPLVAPLRFFLTAPLFACLAGLLLAVEGGDLFASRWTAGTLAATHLLTVGFMLQVMLGALIQILPVVAGANLRSPLLVARVVHVGLTAGALLLAGGFYFGLPPLLSAAALLLGLAVMFFLGAAGRALLGVPSTSPTIRGLKLALASLGVVVGLGVLMALALAHGWPLPLPALADLHAAWGFGGWGGVLLAAIAYVVVPMFQLTPGYPARPSWWFPGVMLGLLLAWSLGLVAGWPWLVRACQLLAALAGMAFAGLTLRLQLKRRRAKADATFRYWQLGLAACLFALFLLSTVAIWPPAADLPAWPILFGILIIGGGFLPFIAGMLYKIVPFLTWLHLQNFGEAKVPAPAMNKILPDADCQRQMLAYAVALGLVLLALAVPDWLARPAGLAFAGANAWLAWNMAQAFRRYRRHLAEMAVKLAAKSR